jgi:hypothetical protein
MNTEALTRLSLEALDEWIQTRQAQAREALAIYNDCLADLAAGYRELSGRLKKPPAATPPPDPEQLALVKE